MGLGQRLAGQSPATLARLAGVFYLLNIVTAMPAYFAGREHATLSFVFGHLATVCYVSVTVLFYYLFRPVNRELSLAAAAFSMAGSAAGVLSLYHFKLPVNTLVFFGCYCLLIGWLILRSTFLPAFLGVLMMAAGVAWLTYLTRALERVATPYNMGVGGVGEITLTLWLLVAGVKRASATAALPAAG